MGYQLQGRLLEVCSCNTLCPCWVGDDPDGGTCDTAISYHFDKGTIDGVDVSGLTIALACHVPGNILKGNWKAIVFIDERASQAQEDALLHVYTGKAGGPIADLAKLVGEVLDVRRAPITFNVVEGKGSFTVGSTIHATLEPFLGPTGKPTTLVESIFSTVPGSPAYVGKATSFRQKAPELNQDVNLQGHNAILSEFRFEHAAAA
jgi:hypothetical protein